MSAIRHNSRARLVSPANRYRDKLPVTMRIDCSAMEAFVYMSGGSPGRAETRATPGPANARKFAWQKTRGMTSMLRKYLRVQFMGIGLLLDGKPTSAKTA